MGLEITPAYRNLRTRVMFFGLEAEDLFAILALAVIANVLGQFVHREMFGLPMNMVLQYLVPAAQRASPDALQVWQATQLPARLGDVPRKTPRLLGG